MSVPQDGVDPQSVQLPHEFSGHRIMSALLSIFLVVWIGNIWYNSVTSPSARWDGEIPAITTEYNDSEVAVSKEHCDQLQKWMAHDDVLWILGMPTMKTSSKKDTTGQTEIWQYHHHVDKTVQACIIIFIHGVVYSKSRANYADGFVVR